MFSQPPGSHWTHDEPNKRKNRWDRKQKSADEEANAGLGAVMERRTQRGEREFETRCHLPDARNTKPSAASSASSRGFIERQWRLTPGKNHTLSHGSRRLTQIRVSRRAWGMQHPRASSLWTESEAPHLQPVRAEHETGEGRGRGRGTTRPEASSPPPGRGQGIVP